MAETERRLPNAAIGIGSVVIGFHFLTIAILSLAAQSGPWPSPFGASSAVPPPFAGQINGLTMPNYLQPLRMTHNYHFETNRPEKTQTYFEVVLKDELGRVRTTLKFPSDDDNPWVRFRHELLANGLAEDEPVFTPRGEVIQAPGKKMETIRYWESAEGEKVLKLRTQPIHLVPKDRPVYRPRDWSILLAESYMRYCMERENMAWAELIRHVRQPVLPGFLFGDPPPGTFDEQVCSFGELRRGK